SAHGTIFTVMEAELPPEMNEWYEMVMAMMRTRFTDRLGDEDAAKAAYERHNDAVRGAVPAGRLLEWQPADGWEPICAALGVPVPAEPFPVTNTTEEFQQMRGGA